MRKNTLYKTLKSWNFRIKMDFCGKGVIAVIWRPHYQPNICQFRIWILYKICVLLSCPRSLPRLRTCWTKWKTMGTWFTWSSHLLHSHPWVTGDLNKLAKLEDSYLQVWNYASLTHRLTDWLTGVGARCKTFTHWCASCKNFAQDLPIFRRRKKWP